MEKRTLGAALKFYCDKELINAHSAMADTEATCEVLLAQLERYEELETNTAFLSEFSSHKRNVDVAGFIVYNENDQPAFSFGKHKGKPSMRYSKMNPVTLVGCSMPTSPLHQKSFNGSPFEQTQ